MKIARFVSLSHYFFVGRSSVQELRFLRHFSRDVEQVQVQVDGVQQPDTQAQDGCCQQCCQQAPADHVGLSCACVCVCVCVRMTHAQSEWQNVETA